MSNDEAPTERAFLIGQGIAHSYSPPVWTRVFAELELPWSYGLRDVSESELAGVADELMSEQYLGANVTMPYKRWAFDLVDERDKWVQRAEVCNWISWRDDGWTSTNTDAQGTAALLDETAPARTVLLLGAGGAGGAVLAALHGRAERVVIASRTRAKSEHRARHAAAWLDEVRVVDFEQRMSVAADADMIINTTPIGMRDRPGSPLESFTPRDDLRIMDAVYGAEPTVLERQADAWGVPYTCGLAYLEAQGTALLGPLGLHDAPHDVFARSLAAVVGRPSRHWTVTPAG